MSNSFDHPEELNFHVFNDSGSYRYINFIQYIALNKPCWIYYQPTGTWRRCGSRMDFRPVSSKEVPPEIRAKLLLYL